MTHDAALVVLHQDDELLRAELRRGRRPGDAARGVDDFAMLDISEGLGLGVMHNGRIVQGHSGLAGELGHITVQLDGGELTVEISSDLQVNLTGTAEPIYRGQMSDELVHAIGAL